MPPYLRPSYYNFYWHNRAYQNYLWYNAKSNALWETDQDTVSRMEQMDLTVSETDALLASGFLTCDSVQQEKQRAWEQSINQSPRNIKVLSVTILPTMACNCRCFYCFEPGASQWASRKMSAGTQEKIIRWIQQEVERRRIVKVVVTWYGGEPLLCLDIILSMQQAITDICSGKKIPYISNMVSNGILLTKEVADQLLAVGIDRVQITLDGIGETHNARRRHLKHPEANFATLIDNIRQTDERLRITIRLNVDAGNIHSVYDTVRYLETERIWPYQKNITAIYLGYLDNGIGSGKINVLERKDFLSFQEQFRIWMVHEYNRLQSGQSAKLKFEYPKTFRPESCGYTTNPHAWVIDAQGKCYRCWEAVGDESLAIETIENLLEQEQQISCWTVSPSDRESWECFDCQYLPICGTKCPFPFIISINRGRACVDWKLNLEEKLISQYNFYRAYPSLVKGFPPVNR